ncbi:MAG: bifunctional adenosylcobinamide kinase/adenosylcobinamide-phosphate guanylyltransferase [Mangrovibacterium sp.]
MNQIHLITGGQRSGKSRHAQELALAQTDNPIYLATSRIWDDDFKQRVERHRNDRGDNWTTIEIPVHIAQAEVQQSVVVLDCITLWLTNLFFDHQDTCIDEIFHLAKTELNQLFAKDTNWLIISNEIGMGGHAENEVARRFTDLQGWVNQYIASVANEVTLMVSGIAVKVK